MSRKPRATVRLGARIAPEAAEELERICQTRGDLPKNRALEEIIFKLGHIIRSQLSPADRKLFDAGKLDLRCRTGGAMLGDLMRG
jgi:hypothetical protein